MDLAEVALEKGESLPLPDPDLTDPESDLEEPIYLLLQAASRVAQIPQDALT